MAAEEKVDVIIVGGGLAGITAALVCARAGLETVLFERGEYPGSKNLSGGVLFTPTINQLIPEFWTQAPIERPVTKKLFSFLSRERSLAFEFSSREFAKPPYNNSFTVLRAKFDKWYAEQAEAAGAFIITETVVDDVILDSGRVVGVKARRDEGEMYADVVIIAEGANAFLPARMGLRKVFSPDDMVTGVKEVWSLPAGTIEDRFNLEPGEGASIDYFGEGACMGMLGAGYVYTNKDTLSVGIGVNIGDVMRKRVPPNNLLDYFKSHPSIKQLLKDAKLEEMSAHQIPEYGYKKFFDRYGDGYLIVGDAAGFVNTSLYHEGTNYATASGLHAAETAIEAKEKGDFSKVTLAGYERRLRESFVLQDLYRFRDVATFMHRHPEFLGKYPEEMIQMAETYFTVSGEPKEKILKRAVRGFSSKLSLFKMSLDTYRLMLKVLGIHPTWFIVPPKK